MKNLSMVQIIIRSSGFLLRIFLTEDIRLMKLAYINTVTLGVFAWAALEPEEGVWDFGWLDKVMDNLHENGIQVILATPSGARPAWLGGKISGGSAGAPGPYQKSVPGSG